MTVDKFWMTLHRMQYQVKWELSYLVVEKDGTPLATIDRWEENAYVILKEGRKLIPDDVMLLIASLASTKLSDREPKMIWEMKNDKRSA